MPRNAWTCPKAFEMPLPSSNNGAAGSDRPFGLWLAGSKTVLSEPKLRLQPDRA
jgi:hypothetical protein